MPPGGLLTLASTLSKPRPFTHADNEPHGQLWTPLLRGDSTTLNVSVPTANKHALKLTLAAVNHGFRSLKSATAKIGGDRSSACNIDVACASAGLAISPLIKHYADQIRSVGAYTLNGTDICSGALVNNTARDSRPLFLTAEHCGITAANAPSMVTYWNFQNSTCRTPGSSASGSVGDGPLDQFNTGAILRASSSRSDFCLVELDDPVHPDANVFFAGWDRSGSPTTSACAVHHPAIAEKRISFDFDPVTITTYFGENSPGDGTHLRVADWDEGTTEGGSSGSPLFDQSGRIVGQLAGGSAACGNDSSDWFGALSASWTGGATNGSRLSNWLDPTSSGTTFIDGQNQDEILVATATGIIEGPAGTGSTLTFTVTLSETTTDTVTVTASTADGTATAGQDYTAVTAQILTFPPGTTTRTVDVTIHGDDTPEEHETLSLVLSSATGAFATTTPATAEIRNDDFVTPVITNTGPLKTALSTTLSFPVTAANTPTSYSLTTPPPGASIDPATGHVTFTPTTTGSTSLNLTASNPAGSTSTSITVEVSENPLLLALDLDPQNNPTTFPDAGANPWNRVTGVTHDGTDAAASAPISSNSTSSLRLAFPGPEAVSAFWKVSSEFNFDFLAVFLDGTLHDSISGQVDWRKLTLDFPEPGPHTLEFRYSKDDSESAGDDTGWVDQITFASTSDAPFPTSPDTAVAQVGLPLTHRFTFFTPPSSVTSTSTPPPGLTFDPTSATLSGTPPTTGSYTFTARATGTGSNTTESTLALTVIPPLYPALDLPPSSRVTTSGNAFWTATTVSHDGVDALRSGPVGDSQQSSLSLTVQGPDTVIFWSKVSSEPGFDELQLLLDGEIQQSVSGGVDWQQRSLKIPGGTHTVTWRYVKDSSSDGGDDAAYIDQVTLASALTTPLIIAPSNIYLEHLAPFYYEPGSAGNPTAFSAVGLPRGITIDPLSGTLSGTPTSPGIFPATLTASNANGSTRHSLTFEVLPPVAPSVDQPFLTFSQSGAAPWRSGSDTSVTGGSSARSGSIGDDQASALSVTIPGPVTGSFWWRVSSEGGFDFLEYSIDDLFQNSITGETSWAEVSFDLPAGTHTLTWTYRKDASAFEADDAGYLDNLTLEFPPASLPAWLAANSLSPATDPTTGTPPLLVRYALGLPATAPADLADAIVLNPGTSLTIHRDPTRSNVQITVEASPDLSTGSWSSSLLETLTDTPSQLTVRPLPTSSPRLFFRPPLHPPYPLRQWASAPVKTHPIPDPDPIS